MTLHCIRGCVVPRRHLQQTCLCDCHQDAEHAYACSVEGGCYEQHQHDECAGCLPRLASVGQLCIHCHGRLVEAVGKIPDLIEWLRECVEPGAVRRDDMPRAAGRHSPAPLNLDAVDTADRLYAALADWHETVTDELDLSPYMPTAYVAGKRLQGISTQHAHSAATMAGRISTHLDRACVYEWSGEMTTELTDVVREALRRYPDEERPLYLPTPCPACDMLSLIRTAPQAFLGQAVISCRTCKETIAESLYAWHARRVLEGMAEHEEDEVPA